MLLAFGGDHFLTFRESRQSSYTSWSKPEVLLTKRFAFGQIETVWQ